MWHWTFYCSRDIPLLSSTLYVWQCTPLTLQFQNEQYLTVALQLWKQNNIPSRIFKCKRDATVLQGSCAGTRRKPKGAATELRRSHKGVLKEPRGSHEEVTKDGEMHKSRIDVAKKFSTSYKWLPKELGKSFQGVAKDLRKVWLVSGSIRFSNGICIIKVEDVVFE